MMGWSGRLPVDRDSGVATIVAAMISMALLAMLWIGVQLGTATITRHRTEGAADLAALAAAAYAPRGTEQACARAEWVASKMRAAVLACRLDGWNARVELRASPPNGPLAAMTSNARAMAGPVTEGTGPVTEGTGPVTEGTGPANQETSP